VAEAEQLVVFDTMIAEKVIAGNRQWRLDLGNTTKRYGLGVKDVYVDLCMKAGICPSEIPRSMLRQRVAKDVDQTSHLFEKQLVRLESDGLLPVFFTRCLLTTVLADIEFNGMNLDAERVTKAYREYAAEAEGLLQELELLSGGINLNSGDQLADFLYGSLGFSEPRDSRGNPARTASGKRKTDSATLAGLTARTGEQRRFLELYQRYNKVTSALSKNLDFFYGVITEGDGTFQGTFNQTVTQTHRLSSSGRAREFQMFLHKNGKPKPKKVQFQNMPKAFKKLFKARKRGWKMAEGDGAQLEFRVAAHVGRDEVAITSIREKFDVHSFTASELNDIPLAHFDRYGNAGHGVLRDKAKADTFKPLYGGRSGTKAQMGYYEAFRERYPGITGAQEDWIGTVLRTKKLRVASGLIFYWPDTRRDQKTGYVSNTPSICNYPIQSYATADIIPIALVYLWHAIKALQLRSFIVNTIHDSIIGEVHPEEQEIYRALLNEAFTRYTYYYLGRVYGDQFTVPLAAGWKCATHWSEGEELEHVEEPPTDVDYREPYQPMHTEIHI